MSTRCNIHFNGRGKIQANVYRHCDGYPEGVLPDLRQFFSDVEEQTGGDTRFGDPQYLAAKFIVWQAGQYTKPDKYHPNGRQPLDFLGVSPCMEDHGDIEFVYTVDCDNHDADGHPTVTWKSA